MQRRWWAHLWVSAGRDRRRSPAESRDPQLQGLLRRKLCSPLRSPTSPSESPGASYTADILVPSHMQVNKYSNHIQVSKSMILKPLVFQQFFFVGLFMAQQPLLQMKPYQEGKRTQQINTSTLCQSQWGEGGLNPSPFSHSWQQTASKSSSDKCNFFPISGTFPFSVQHLGVSDGGPRPSGLDRTRQELSFCQLRF